MRTRNTPSRRQTTRSFELLLPATSANLGPAFDAAALALDLFLRVSFQQAREFSVEAKGRDRDVCGRAQNHLILTTYREVLEEANRPVQPVALRIANEIPIGKGCGSSAAARLAGIAMAVDAGKLGWDDKEIVGEAARREHHPDNAAACWWGGFAIARSSGEGATEAISVDPKGKWRFLLAIPEDSLSTEKARAVLPKLYSRTDAVSNVQSSMFLLASLSEGRQDLLGSVFEDRLHQPYRAHLCPLLPVLQKLSGKDGILGAVLSGAGPSVLMFLNRQASVSRAKAQVRAQLTASGLTAELIETTITRRGARGSWLKW
jgi:homoserine kinase